jgi:hypothetical protein
MLSSEAIDNKENIISPQSLESSSLNNVKDNSNSNSNTDDDNNDDYDDIDDYDDDNDDDNDDTEQWRHLRILEQESIKLLIEACKHGRVIIISNAESAWIDYTLKHYFPSLASTVVSLNVSVISARDKFIQQYPTHPLSWKVGCFRQEIFAHIHQNHQHHHYHHHQHHQHHHHHKTNRFSIMSIGDGMHEKIACESICNEIQKEHLTLKLFESPSPLVLHRQLSIITGITIISNTINNNHNNIYRQLRNVT